jgi:putative ABC transport system substrate-binding protein
MKRFLDLVGLLAVALATCSSLAAAQSTTASPKRLGFLSGLGCSTDANPSPMRRRLTELGWIGGQTLIVDCVSTVYPDQAGTLAAELVARRPDVLAAQPIDYVRALKQATAAIPIVMVTTPNPVESGIVTNVARPEANVTGVMSSGREVAAKRIGLLKRLLPRLAKLAVIERQGGDAVVHAQLEKDVTDAATKLGFAWQAFDPAAPEDYDAIFARLAAEGFDAAYVEPGPLLDANQTRIAGLAIRHRIPTAGNYPYHAENGLLLAYGESADPSTSAPRNTSTKSCAAPSPPIFRSRGRSSSAS